VGTGGQRQPFDHRQGQSPPRPSSRKEHMGKHWIEDLNEAKLIRKRAKGVANPTIRRGLQNEADERVKRALRKLKRQRKTRVSGRQGGTGSGREGLRVRG